MVFVCVCIKTFRMIFLGSLNALNNYKDIKNLYQNHIMHCVIWYVFCMLKNKFESGNHLNKKHKWLAIIYQFVQKHNR